MTKFAGNWKDREHEYFIICRRLADGKALRRTDLESKRYRPQGSIPNEPSETDADRIPHTSLIKRLDELSSDGSIKVTKTKDKSKKGLPINEYQLTFYGFLKLLGLSKKHGFLPDVMTNIKSRFTSLWFNFDFLKNLFTEEDLFDTLTTVCSNMTIVIDRDPRKGKMEPPVGISARFYLKEFEWVHLYYVELKVQQLELMYTLRDNLVIGGKKQDVNKENGKAYLFTSGIVVSAFFYELLMRCNRDDPKWNHYKQNFTEEIIKIMEENKVMLPFYLQFLRKLELNVIKETQIMNNLMTHLHTAKMPKDGGKLWKSKIDNLYEKTYSHD